MFDLFCVNSPWAKLKLFQIQLKNTPGTQSSLKKKKKNHEGGGEKNKIK